MQEIVLKDPEICGMPCSVQLRNNGIAVSDSTFKDTCKSIYALFSEEASSYYEEIGQGVYDDGDPGKWCQLCGERTVRDYFHVRNASGAPIRTVHTGSQYAFNFILTWPEHMKLGSTCIKKLNVKVNKAKMYNSMIEGHHPFNLTQNGLILTGKYLITKNDIWKNNLLVIPHSLFTLLPEWVYTETGAEVFRVNNAVELGECTEKSLYRSFTAKSRDAKYGIDSRLTDIVVRSGFCGTDRAFPNLVTVLSRRDANNVIKLFRNRSK